MTPDLNHKYIKVEEGDRIYVIILKMTTGKGIDHLVEKKTHHTDVEKILVKIIGKTKEGDHKTILGMTIEETTTENKGIEIGVEIETIVVILIENIVVMTIWEVEISVETGVE